MSTILKTLKMGRKHFGWAVLASELSHVFCCIIPTVVTILSVLSNLGLFVISPHGWLINIHNAMHSYEIPLIVFSGVMVVLGWVAHAIGNKVDCHDTGCCHPPCPSKTEPQKSRNTRIMVVATLLFIVNIVIYFGVHRNVFHLEMFRPHPVDQRAEHNHSHESL